MRPHRDKGKRIFIVGASDFQLPAILTAKEMGFFVGVADINPKAVGVKFADQFFEVSTIDEKGICNAAREFHADGILTLCTDMPMRAVAYTCEELGLIGLDISAAIASTDKGVMLKAFEREGVAHPQFKIFVKNSDLKELNDLCFPAVTKPIDNSGSRGIMLVNSKDELRSALEYSSENGRSGDVIVEEYMRGPEFSIEIMVIDGIPHILQVTDKLTTGSPHFVEIGHSEPSRFQEEILQQIREMAMKAALAVGVKNGPAHAEIIYTDDGPKLVEIGARMGGGYISTHLVPLSTGIDMTKATIQLALGEQPDIKQTLDKGSAIRFIIPPEGEVVSISGKKEAEAVPGVKLVEIQCHVGQFLTRLENGTSRVGHVIAQANTPLEAVEICEEALSKIKIVCK